MRGQVTGVLAFLLCGVSAAWADTPPDTHSMAQLPATVAKADEVFPHFLVTHLAPGLGGLFIAALAGSAMAANQVESETSTA